MKTLRYTMKTLLAVTICFVLLPQIAAAEELSQKAQIASAVLAAPEDRRDGATVLSWDGKGPAVTLREGTNELVCLANNPNAETWDSSRVRRVFQVACYHKDLEPFMARGRELTASGTKDDSVRDQLRWKEIDEGKLPFPREPRMLHALEGKDFDTATGQVIEPYRRWVIYVPYATAASTGIQTKSAPGVPWLMNPGTAGAHVMISPPR